MTDRPVVPNPFAGSALDIVLHSPRIAHNVGAVGRLCAVFGTPLHLVRPMPFSFDDKSLQRVGMDYLDILHWHIHDDWAACRGALPGRRVWLMTTHAEQTLDQIAVRPGDAFVFGSEPEGAPDWLHAEIGDAHSVRIPHRHPATRSLNLATACAIVLWEAWRQIDQASSPGAITQAPPPA